MTEAAVWVNEYHGDFLARDRLAEARRAADRRALIGMARRPADARRGVWARLAKFVVRRDSGGGRAPALQNHHHPTPAVRDRHRTIP